MFHVVVTKMRFPLSFSYLFIYGSCLTFFIYGITWLPFASEIRFIGLSLTAFFFAFKKNQKIFNLKFVSIALFIAITNIIFSIDMLVSFRAFFILIIVLAIEYMITRNVSIEDRLKVIFKVLRLFFLLSIFAYVLGDSRVSDNIFGNDSLLFGNAFGGVFESVNYFYFFLFIYQFVLLIQNNSFKKNFFDLFIIGIIYSIILIVFPQINRTFILSNFIFLYFYFFKEYFSVKFKLIISAILFAIVISAIQIESDLLTIYGIKIADILEYGIFGNRTILWNTSIEAMIDNNYIFYGNGLGNQKLMLANYDLTGFEGLHAHSTYFGVLLDFGLLPSILILGFIFFASIKNLLRYRDIYNIDLIPLFFGLMVFSIFDSIFIEGFNVGHFIIFTLFVFSGLLPKQKFLKNKLQ